MKTKILQRFYICLLTGLVGGLLLYGNGCQFRRPFLKKHQPVNIKTSTPVSKLEQAALLQKTGNDLEAVMLYREAILCSRNRNEVDLAKIGAAECLIKSKKFPAALAVLEPLSAEIITENEMRKLALAGEILLHLGRTKEAEACLEAALGVLDLETLLDQVHSEDALEFDAWIPAATANLGCAYLKNDKPEYAMTMYQFASCLYRKNGDLIHAEKSQRIYGDLANILRQYAPFKPIPVAKGIPSGRSER